jgi:hypothetical protein
MTGDGIERKSKASTTFFFIVKPLTYGSTCEQISSSMRVL